MKDYTIENEELQFSHRATDDILERNKDFLYDFKYRQTNPDGDQGQDPDTIKI